MGTIADKLTYLNTTKAAIKAAIVDKGVSVSDTDTFRSYADKITSIETGGGGGGGGFTPRLIYSNEGINATMFDVTNKETYFECKVKTGANPLNEVDFVANVNCYIMVLCDEEPHVLSIGKVLNAGESFYEKLYLLGPSRLTVRVYPTAEYDYRHLTIGVLSVVEEN